jgi:hypothetical protein
VFEASTALKNKTALKSFKEQNKLQDKGTFSQYRTIGEHYDFLRPHASSLPSSWYTLYKIAKLDAKTRDSAIADGTLDAFSTQRDVRELSGAATAPRPKSEVLRYSVELTDTDLARVKEFDAALTEIALKFAKSGVAVTIDKSKALKTMLASPASMKPAA